MKNSSLLSILLISLLFGLFSLMSSQAYAAECNPLAPGNLDSQWDIPTGRAWVTNRTSSCTFQIGLSSLAMSQPYSADPNNLNWLFTQQFYDGYTTNVGPGQRIQLQVKIPPCLYQLDLYYGALITNFTAANYQEQNSRVIKGRVNTDLPVCSQATPTPQPTATPTPVPATPTPVPATPTPTPVQQVLGVTKGGLPIYATPQTSQTPQTGPGILGLITLIPSAALGLVLRRRI